MVRYEHMKVFGGPSETEREYNRSPIGNLFFENSLKSNAAVARNDVIFEMIVRIRKQKVCGSFLAEESHYTTPGRVSKVDCISILAGSRSARFTALRGFELLGAGGPRRHIWHG
jgi:hypothetical protein